MRPRGEHGARKPCVAAHRCCTGRRPRPTVNGTAQPAPSDTPDRLNRTGALAAVDFVTLSSHKFHGPEGVGVLTGARRSRLASCTICRSPNVLQKPLMYGGHQQAGLRPGTEAVGAIVAMSQALEAINETTKLTERTASMRRMSDAVWKTLMPFVVTGLVLPTGCIDTRERACHHVSFCVRGARRQAILASLFSYGRPPKEGLTHEKTRNKSLG